MLESLPKNESEILDLNWVDLEPYYQDLTGRELDQETVHQWLTDWSSLIDLGSEMYARLNVAVTLDTTDEVAEASFNAFLENIYPAAQSANQVLREKLLASGLEPAGFEIPLRKMRTEASIFREENLNLLIDDRKLGSEYNKIIGAQTVKWKGEELTIQQTRPVLQTSDRTLRERLWVLSYERQLADRQKINDLWKKEVQVRVQLALNAGLPNYRSYR